MHKSVLGVIIGCFTLVVLFVCYLFVEELAFLIGISIIVALQSVIVMNVSESAKLERAAARKEREERIRCNNKRVIEQLNADQEK